MSFIFILILGFVVLITGIIGNGNNNLAAFCAVVFFISAVALYFAPTMVAIKRNHSNQTSIIVLNILLGWTVLGWVGALVWAYSSGPNSSTKDFDPATSKREESAYNPWNPAENRQAQTQQSPTATKLCPFCAEEIKFAAIKCKHCGSEITPDETEILRLDQAEKLHGDARPIHVFPPSEVVQMAEYGITIEGDRYAYGEFRYSNLADAVSYAKLERKQNSAI